MARSVITGLRLSPEEAAVLQAVSAETGLSLSDVLRQAFRKVYAKRFRAVSAKKAKPR